MNQKSLRSRVIEWARNLPDRKEQFRSGASFEARAYYDDLAAELKRNPMWWAKIEESVTHHNRQGNVKDGLTPRLSSDGEVEVAIRAGSLWVRFVPYRLDLG